MCEFLLLSYYLGDIRGVMVTVLFNEQVDSSSVPG